MARSAGLHSLLDLLELMHSDAARVRAEAKQAIGRARVPGSRGRARRSRSQEESGIPEHRVALGINGVRDSGIPDEFDNGEW